MYKAKRELREEFKELFNDEFSDPNESFMDFLLDLISKDVLEVALKRGKRFYYSRINKYK